MKKIIALAVVLGATLPVWAQEPENSCVLTELGKFCLTVKEGVLVVRQVEPPRKPQPVSCECEDIAGVWICCV